MSVQFPDNLTSFPRNLSWNLKKIQSSIIKSKIKINSDLTEIKPSQTSSFFMPIGRFLDFRSGVLYSTNATCSGTGGIHFPRLGLASLIQNLQILANGRVLQSTNDYNMIYNILCDCEGYSSFEQATKRITENFDPSVTYTYPNGSSDPVATFNANNTTNDGGGTNDNKSYCVNNWLGFMNGSISCLNTNDIGQLTLKITWAPASACWYKTDATAPTDASYSLKDVFFTIDALTFTNNLYLTLVGDQLKNDGLNVGYYDYVFQQFSSQAKSTGGINISTQINTSSLDQVIATFRPNNYDTISELCLSTQVATTNKTYQELAVTPLTTSAGVGTSQLGTYGAFNQSLYFRRDGSGYSSSSFYVNSSLALSSDSPIEVFNNSLQALSYNNLDIGSGGYHSGCHSLGFWCKNYFVDILSLENMSQDNNFWISGYNSNGGSIQIGYISKWATTTTVYPILIMRVTKQLNIKFGRLLDLVE